MSGPDPNQPIPNVSPVVSPGTQQAAPGAAPAYIAPAPAPRIPMALDFATGFDMPQMGGSAMQPQATTGPSQDVLGAALRNGISTAFTGQPAAPATATDAVAAPQPPHQAAQHSAAGTPMSTFNSGEQHPQTHTLEDFVNANRHLTLHDITKLMPGILPGMDPHRQMVQEAYAGLVSQRDAAFKQALALEQKGDVAGANALRQHAASEHMKNLMPLIASNNPYAAMGAAQSYGTTP